MDFRLLNIVLLVAPLAAGCASSPDLAPLERENRLLEDRVYQLEDELDRHCDLVDSYERENQELREKLKGGDGQLTPPQVELGTPAANLSPALRRRLPPDEGDRTAVASSGNNGRRERAERPERRPTWSPNRPPRSTSTVSAASREGPTWTPNR